METKCTGINITRMKRYFNTMLAQLAILVDEQLEL